MLPVIGFEDWPSEGGIRIAYPKKQISRGEAWENLLAQQIPNCPSRPGHTNPWRRDHNLHEWAWVWVGHGGVLSVSLREWRKLAARKART